MKYFLIADDQGNPIFYNHPNGRLICPSLNLTFGGQLNHVFDEQCRSLRCGDTQFVVQQVNQLTFLVVSNQGESEIFLRRQLQLVQQMLMLLYGPVMPSEKRQAKMQERQQRQELLKRLIDTLCWLCEKHQSFLIDANEQLEVNEDIRARCLHYLKESLKQLPGATHALLFVGTKLLALYSKPKAPEMDTLDLLLLAIYVQGQFHPKTVEMEETFIPVADYTDHEQVVRELQEKMDKMKIPAESPAATPPTQPAQPPVPTIFPRLPPEFAYLRDCGKGIFQQLFDELIRDEPAKPNKKLLEFEKKGMPIWELCEQYRQAPPPPGLPIVILQEGLHLTYPEFPNLAVTGVFDDDTKSAVVEFQKSHGIDETGLLDFETVKLILHVAANPQDYTPKNRPAPTPAPAPVPSPSPSPAQTPPTPQASPSPSLSSSASSKSAPLDSLFETLHLKVPKHTPHFVYCTKLQETVTLIVINKKEATNDDANVRDQLRGVRHNMRKSLQNYLDFLLTKEHTHLSMLSYMNQFPGLVHFIFVDRIKNRMIAPAITPLHGQEFVSLLDPARQKKFSDDMVSVIKHKVWELCYQAQIHLSKGYNSMLVKDGCFKYSYRFWVQDEDGCDLPMEQPLIFQKGAIPLDYTYYKQLIAHMFPSRRRLKCFELYTLYLGFVSPKTITSHNAALVYLLSGEQ